MQQTNWFYKTAIYQIYPRSFFDSNNDGIGDINGIIEKLDYIKNIGFETIWISPFYTSPQLDFGYDIADYYNIDTNYGTMHDVEKLIKEVHQRNMFVVFDMVMNHTSNQHQWFAESKKNKTNDKADWYIWRDKPNNWKSVIGTNGWQYCKERNQYYYASFLPFQPDLNYRNDAVKKAMFDVVEFWLQKGVDGFRLDIFNCIIKDKNFKNNPFSINPIPTVESPGGNFQKRKYSLNLEENFTLAQELRTIIDKYNHPKRLLLGEVFGEHPTIKKYLGQQQDGLHLAFLFDILFFKFNANFFKNKIETYNQFYPKPYFPTIVFSNHDQFRSIKRIQNNIEKAKLLAFIQYTLRGVPTIYYGEEIGMTNANIAIKNGKDALTKVYNWVPQCIANILPVAINRDVCRTPMQWNNTQNAGFCANEVDSWLPINKNKTTINVATQLQEKNSLLQIFKQLNFLRKENLALNEGDINIVFGQKNILAFERKAANQQLLIIINFSTKEQPYQLPNQSFKILFSLHENNINTENVLKIHSFSGIIFQY